ncbi:MAG: alpha/beta hydrolase, partial [Planctomycetes bacterium]|nr:alpha/beta hydrolase [Planctomycetota bacterium]
RYQETASDLVAAGWAVTAGDLRGHGKSGGKRGAIRHWADYVADAKAVASLIPSGRFVLLGHSMGGMVALNFLSVHGGSVSGLVLSSPALRVGVKAPAWKTGAASFLSKLWPDLRMGNELDSDQITADREVVAAYLADPLVFHTVTPRWFTELLLVQEKQFEMARQSTVPLWLFHGADEAFVDISSFRTLVDAWPSIHHSSLTCWPNRRHECLNDTGRADVISVLISQLEAFSSQSA